MPVSGLYTVWSLFGDTVGSRLRFPRRALCWTNSVLHVLVLSLVRNLALREDALHERDPGYSSTRQCLRCVPSTDVTRSECAGADNFRISCAISPRTFGEGG